MNLHKLDLNEIRGFGRNKPLLKGIFLMGYLGIIGMPLWSGYISKTLLHESIVEYIEILAEAGMGIGVFKAVEWIFLISGGLTVAYMTKLFVAVFVEKNPYEQEKMEASDKKYMNRESMFALGIPALLLPLFGILPNIFMTGIAELGQGFMHGESPAHAVAYFSWINLKGAVISLAIGAAVYFGVIRTWLMKKDENGNKVYVNTWPSWLDLENLIYRPLIQKVLPAIGGVIGIVFDKITDGIAAFLQWSVLRKFRVPERRPEDFEPDSIINHVRVFKLDQRITGSFSFGLLMFGFGFCVAMLYLLFTLILK